MNQTNTSNNLDHVVLLVSDDSATDRYYKLPASMINILIRIHGKGFGFYGNGVFCDTYPRVPSPELVKFVTKFYHHGWEDIAQLIEEININDDHARCLNYNYSVFLHH